VASSGELTEKRGAALAIFQVDPGTSRKQPRNGVLGARDACRMKRSPQRPVATVERCEKCRWCTHNLVQHFTAALAPSARGVWVERVFVHLEQSVITRPDESVHEGPPHTIHTLRTLRTLLKPPPPWNPCAPRDAVEAR
jgi:hypothetical protein